jgi:hypothetical protein
MWSDDSRSKVKGSLEGGEVWQKPGRKVKGTPGGKLQVLGAGRAGGSFRQCARTICKHDVFFGGDIMQT